MQQEEEQQMQQEEEQQQVRRDTLLFNTFVACQLFNELNARSIGDDINVFAGLLGNAWFLGVIVFTVITQYGLITYGGDFTKTCPMTQVTH